MLAAAELRSAKHRTQPGNKHIMPSFLCIWTLRVGTDRWAVRLDRRMQSAFLSRGGPSGPALPKIQNLRDVGITKAFGFVAMPHTEGAKPQPTPRSSFGVYAKKSRAPLRERGLCHLTHYETKIIVRNPTRRRPWGHGSWYCNQSWHSCFQNSPPYRSPSAYWSTCALSRSPT